MSAVIAAPAVQPPSLLAKIAGRYSVEPNKMLATLKQTAFRLREGEVSNEQMMALLIVADQYRLNPFTREIYAFPDKNNGVVPVVGVDGWLRIINEHLQFDGIEFVDGPAAKDGLPEWIEAVIYRRDRSHSTRAREYMVECRRGVQPWQTHPRRMLRHKAMIQCARIAFSFVGIYDEDEAQRIAESQIINPQGNDTVAALNATITQTMPQLQNIPSDTLQPSVSVTQEKVAVAQMGERESIQDAGSNPAGDANISAADDPAAGVDAQAVEMLVADWIAAIEGADSEEALGELSAKAEKALRESASDKQKAKVAAAIDRADKRLKKK